MADVTESFDRMPIWQKLLMFLLVSAGIVAVWWFLFYADVLEAKANAEGALVKADTELERVKTRKANFLEEQRKHEEHEKALQAEMKVLPMSASTVDNLMQTFQQRARMVGMSVESWTNEAEERQDPYARLPIRVKAIGTWSQLGEFFRRIAELEQPVSIENLSFKANAPEEPGASPQLDVEFEAAAYRLLTPEERTGGAADGKKRPAKSRRTGKGGK
jgi:type IV pilus assembly protein PilO